MWQREGRTWDRVWPVFAVTGALKTRSNCIARSTRSGNRSGSGGNRGIMITDVDLTIQRLSARHPGGAV